MGDDHTQLTAEQARQQLDASQSRSLGTPGDRKIHAVGTAVLGLSIGLFMAPRNLVSGLSHVIASVTFVAVWLGGAVWMERAARTVPRRAKLWSRLGIGTSFVVALFAVIPWLNLRAQTEPNTWPMVLAGAIIIAIPSLLAGALIAGGRKWR